MMTWKIALTSAATVIASAITTTVYLDEKKEPTSVNNHDQLMFVPVRSRNTMQDAIKKAEQLCNGIKDECGTPGLVVSVTVDGKPVFSRGFGFADVENHVECKSNTVMRIASISKSITMAVVAKLWQEDKLSLDAPIQQYVSSFPQKSFNGEEVEITVRHLLSHLSGIRHYEKVQATNGKSTSESITNSNNADPQNGKQEEKDEFENKEYLLNTYYRSVTKSLSLFQDDELHHSPGTKFLYTTHGWTLVSAAVETVVKKPFSQYMKSFFHEMGLRNTFLDENKPIIYNRARYYVRNAAGRLENAPNVDNSYKWAGGGFLSTSDDLTKFGNAMLYSFQNDGGFLDRKTAALMWTPVNNTKMSWDKDGSYAMGWGVVPSKMNYPFCNTREFYISHTGGAVGASSVLLIYPRCAVEKNKEAPVRGVVVAMIANLQSVGLNKTALEIAKVFDEVES